MNYIKSYLRYEIFFMCFFASAAIFVRSDTKDKRIRPNRFLTFTEK